MGELLADADLERLIGLKADPSAAPPRLIAAAVSGSKPSRRVSRRRIGTNAMISSCMFSVIPPSAKARTVIGMTSVSRRPNRFASQATASPSAPVCSTTAKAPPTQITRKTTDAASTSPLGTATTAWNIPTGAGGTLW